MTQSIDKALIQKIARLTNLDISEEETLVFGEQITRIVGYVQKLDELNISEDESQVLKPFIRERADVLEEFCDKDLLIREAGETVGTAFKVPKIIG